MNYSGIKARDVANGPGVRVSLFVSGCTHHCKGCFNPETWDFKYGDPFTAEVEDRILGLLEPWYVKGLSLLGGEPMEPANQEVLLPFLRRVKEKYPDKTIWCYSGYRYEEDLASGRLSPLAEEILGLLDVLVDGEFHLEEKDPRLKFRGSANQRLIDVPASRAAGRVVLWST